MAMASCGSAAQRGMAMASCGSAAQRGMAMASSSARFFYHTHNDEPQSVGLLRTSDQLVAETST
jgi:hypothetical protein